MHMDVVFSLVYKNSSFLYEELIFFHSRVLLWKEHFLERILLDVETSRGTQNGHN